MIAIVVVRSGIRAAGGDAEVPGGMAWRSTRACPVASAGNRREAERARSRRVEATRDGVERVGVESESSGAACDRTLVIATLGMLAP
jgi:hypothetical protein